jgi:alpha-tubulin suppressor-like RCC1 family protein
MVTSTATPTQIMRERGVSNIFCGPYNTFLVTSKGEVYGMGLNSRGQLGIGNDIDQRNGPVLIESLSTGKKVQR